MTNVVLIHFNTNDERSPAFYKNACGAHGVIGNGFNNSNLTHRVTCDPCRSTLAFMSAVEKEKAQDIKVPRNENVWHSPSYGALDDFPPATIVHVPVIPFIMISNGEKTLLFDDDFKGPSPDSISPIALASYIARLRALADVLENS